jgi:Caspase domain
VLASRPVIALTVAIVTVSAAAEPNDVDIVFRGAEYTGVEVDSGSGTGVLPPRYALVIGIDTYSENALALGNLSHPVSDADKVGRALKDAGFEVTEITSLPGPVTRNNLLNAIETFNAKVRRPGSSSRPPVVALYFSGHGVSALGQDGTRRQYVVPSDFRPMVAADVPEMAIPVEALLQRLGKPTPAPTLRIVIIDACRSDVNAMLPTDAPGAAARYEPWQTFMPSDPAPKNGGRNGLIFAYATGSREAAVDNGLLANALVDALVRMRAEAKATDTGRTASFSALMNALQIAVQGADGNRQRPEYLPFKNTSEFFIYSTEYDRDVEVFNWESTRKLRDSDTIAAHQEYWCRLQAMKRDFSEYSYLSPMIDAEQNDKFNNPCANTSLNVTLDQSERLDDAAKISIRQLADSAAPSLGQVASGYGGSLDRSSSADSLAYGAYGAPVLSAPTAQAETVGKISEGDLVQLREGSNSDYIAVRTTDGTAGYVEKAALLRGRAAVDVTLQFRGSQFKFATSDLHLNDLLSHVVVTDASVTYPYVDHLVGLTRAQGVAATFAQVANGGGSQTLLVPRIVAVDADSPEPARLASGQVRLEMSVAPLRKDVRTALGSPLLSGKLTLSNSVDITVLADRLTTVRLPVRPTLATGENNDSGPTIVPRQGLGTSDADRCVEASRSLPRSETSSQVFIQISEREQEKDYDTVAAGLRAVGFVVPAIDLQPPVQRNQVRYCPGGKRAETAQQAAAVLKRCGYLGFSTVPIVDNPNCDKVRDDRVEVWFAQPVVIP